MENKTIRRNLYRVLRKTGVPKNDISLDASFNDDLRFDNIDWSIFTYYLENVFKININDDELKKLRSINDTIVLLRARA